MKKFVSVKQRQMFKIKYFFSNKSEITKLYPNEYPPMHLKIKFHFSISASQTNRSKQIFK